MHQLPELQRTQSEEHNLRKPDFTGQEMAKLARDSREAQEKHRLLKWVPLKHQHIILQSNV
jgi:hypothetical protein